MPNPHQADLEKALQLLARGLATLSEAAAFGGMSRQALHQAAKRRGIDAPRSRAAYLAHLWSLPLERIKRPGKAAMRRRAEQAAELYRWKTRKVDEQGRVIDAKEPPKWPK